MGRADEPHEKAEPTDGVHLLRRKGVIRVLLHISEHGKVDLDGFEKGSGCYQSQAVRLRADLKVLGLLEYEEIPVRGVSRRIENIRLTPLGHEVVRHLLELDPLLRGQSVKAEIRRAPVTRRSDQD